MMCHVMHLMAVADILHGRFDRWHGGSVINGQRKPSSSKMCIEDIRYENSVHVKRGHLNDVVYSKCVSCGVLILTMFVMKSGV